MSSSFPTSQPTDYANALIAMMTMMMMFDDDDFYDYANLLKTMMMIM
jgi:hypothetical protein